MLMMLRDIIKALGKLLVVVFLVAILHFKMAAIQISKWPLFFYHILDYITASELPRELKLVAIPVFVMLRIAINAQVWKVTSCSFGSHLNIQNGSQPPRFQNGCHFQHILAYLTYLESSK